MKPGGRFQSNTQVKNGAGRSHKSALPYRHDQEVDSNLDVSRETDGNVSEDPVLDKFEKNRSHLFKGGRIIINKKGATNLSHHERIRNLRQRMSDGSTKLDTESNNIEVNLPTE